MTPASGSREATVSRGALGPSVLQLDCGAAADRIAAWTRTTLGDRLHRRGLVVAMSGGIDSSVCAALAAHAVGSQKVFGLLLPERDSSPSSLQQGRLLAEHLGVAYEVQDIAPALEGLGCYARRDESIRHVFPEYGSGWKSKIVISGGVRAGIM